MNTMIVTRKGIATRIFTSEDTDKLVAKAEELDGGSLDWQDRGINTIGAHSNHDDERVYSITSAETLD